jgi:hypothetical protein
VLPILRRDARDDRRAVHTHRRERFQVRLNTRLAAAVRSSDGQRDMRKMSVCRHPPIPYNKRGEKEQTALAILSLSLSLSLP